jgi:tetratricopeptide (TPR) repeat protein
MAATARPKRRMVAALALFASLLAPAAGWAKCSLGVFARLPVTISTWRATVPGMINGKPANLVIDSGAFYSVMSRSSADEFGLSVQPAFGLVSGGPTGAVDWSVTTVKSLVIAGIPIPHIQFLVGGSDIVADESAIIGQNILSIGDAEYDLAKGAINLIKPEDCGDSDLAYWVTSNAYSVIDFHHMDSVNPQAIAEAFVNGVSMRVLFDTGAPRSSLSLRAARGAGINLSDPGVVESGYVGGIGRKLLKSWVAPVADFKIGTEEIRNTHLRIAEKPEDDADMILGMDFFLSHHIYVSNKQRKIYFSYNGGSVFNLAPVPASGTTGSQNEVAEPTDADGFARRGAAFAARQQFDLAIADLTKAIATAPAEPKYVYQRALAYLATHQPVPARADLDQVLRLKPDDVPALLASAGLHLVNHETGRAIEELNRANMAAPSQSSARLSLAHLYAGADQYPSAIAQFDMWISQHPEDNKMGEALNDRCWVRALAGRDLDLAIDDCNAALRKLPKNPGILNSRGLVFLRKGEFDKSIADNDAALALEPKLASSYYVRGIAKLHKGMIAEGNSDIVAAIALQPDLPDWAKSHGLAPE